MDRTLVTFAFSLKAFLALADGSIFEGTSIGAHGTTVGEIVFNTSMTGYQEVLTDPSYAGQVVLFTYPMIGNYGINDDDFESDRIQPRGIIVGECCRRPSNWRSKQSLSEYLSSKNVVSLEGVDTRQIAKHIREQGALMCSISTVSEEEAFRAIENAPDYGELDYVKEVSTKIPYSWGYSGYEDIESTEDDMKYRIVALDCGLKHNILRRFSALGVRTIVLPQSASSEEILGWRPDGILLSPGPGDPGRLVHVVNTVKNLIGIKPIFGICLGNQILCHAIGGSTYKLKFGHRGANHPVKDLDDGTVTITSQNHGYAVDENSLDSSVVRVTQRNMNDNTIEGISLIGADATSIQYHPEAAPGPWDSRKYFGKFVETLESYKSK